MSAPGFDTLPGLERRRAPEGTSYLRLGSGPQALVLLNAIGMSLDVWQALAAELRHDCTVLVVDAAAHLPASGLPSAYYDTPDAPARFEAALRAVLQAEGLARCHLAGWCAGAKYAIGLARQAPQLVTSLLLLAPSFAGEASGEGGDSAFETSLHTLCKLVTRMPQAADNMARSMLAHAERMACFASAHARRDLPLAMSQPACNRSSMSSKRVFGFSSYDLYA